MASFIEAQLYTRRPYFFDGPFDLTVGRCCGGKSCCIELIRITTNWRKLQTERSRGQEVLAKN